MKLEKELELLEKKIALLEKIKDLLNTIQELENSQFNYYPPVYYYPHNLEQPEAELHTSMEYFLKHIRGPVTI